MATFAKIDNNNIVVDIIVIPDEQAIRGQEYINSDVGISGTFIETFLDKSKRKNYAVIGGSYDSVADAFIPIKQRPYMVLNEQTCLWDYPVQMPKDGKFYVWSDEAVDWIDVPHPLALPYAN